MRKILQESLETAKREEDKRKEESKEPHKGPGKGRMAPPMIPKTFKPQDCAQSEEDYLLECMSKFGVQPMQPQQILNKPPQL